MRIVEFDQGKVTIELWGIETFYLSQALIYGVDGAWSPNHAREFGICGEGHYNLSSTDLVTIIENASAALLSASLVLDYHARSAEDENSIERMKQQIRMGHPQPQTMVHADSEATSD